MTDIRCPQCGNVFFDHPTSPSTQHDYEVYTCKQCYHPIVLPGASAPDFEANTAHWDVLANSESHSVITCLYCESAVLPYREQIHTDGDTDHLFECPTCEDVWYSVRATNPVTATQSNDEYAAENPFAGFTDRTITDYRRQQRAGRGAIPDDQTEVGEWADPE